MTESVSVNQQKQNSLKDFCVYFDNSRQNDLSENEVDKFVGLKYSENKLQIYFPVGYAHSDSADEKQIRKEILNLISVLSSFGEKCEMLKASDLFSKSSDVLFPIHAYLFIISDFLNHGYFTQKETVYKKSPSGKINWSRTIKQVRPQLVNESIFYFDFITQHTDYNQNELISQIHKYCVWECFSKIGYLFSSFIPQKPAIKFNKILFNSVIKIQAAKTFNENNLLLFKNMLDVINYLDSSNENKNFIYGTQNFHHIWEALVDSVYGEKDKEKFYPKVYWKIKNQNLNQQKLIDFSNSKYNSLRPDTIMITNRGKPGQKIFVLDSKYYRYGATKNPNHLPDSSSVVKQIAYAQYIENTNNKIPKDVQKNLTPQKIYNAFIMPSDNPFPQNIGYTSADYVFPQSDTEPISSYSKIHGILLDIKQLMFRHIPRDKEAIITLSNLIEHGC